MKDIILFSKSLQDHDVPALIKRAHEIGVDGYDLCVRPSYAAVTPDNVADALPDAAKRLMAEGLSIRMVTGNFDLLFPDHPTAEPILAAMDKADVRLIKLGYYKIDPIKMNYWDEVDKIRKGFEKWQELAERYNVKVCYHTHSGAGHMGLNCSALMHLIKGFDPRYIGAYIDPSHMTYNGEPFDLGVAIVKDYLSIVSLKEPALIRVEGENEGGVKMKIVEAGKGMVAWSKVFAVLMHVAYEGPLTVHAEYEEEIPTREEFLSSLKREVAYFRGKRDQALAGR